MRLCLYLDWRYVRTINHWISPSIKWSTSHLKIHTTPRSLPNPSLLGTQVPGSWRNWICIIFSKVMQNCNLLTWSVHSMTPSKLTSFGGKLISLCKQKEFSWEYTNIIPIQVISCCKLWSSCGTKGILG